MCPWTLGTLQCHLSVCGALRGRASHPRPLLCARFGPSIFRQICHLRARSLGVWRWNGGVPRVIKGLVGCPRILRYQPQPFDATVGPSGRTVYHTARAQWPRLAAGRPGSSPSPWHGKVVGSAMTAVRTLGRVCLRAHGPWGHCHAICWCVGSSVAAYHTLDHSCVPDLAPFSAKFATCERGVLGCGDGTAGFHA